MATVVQPTSEGGPNDDWRARVVTVKLTKHARKKLLTRFQIADEVDAMAFVLGVMLAADEVYDRYDGAIAWRHDEVIVVTRPLGDQTHLVLSCFPKGELSRLKARRRALYKRLKREQREMEMADDERD